MKPNSTLRSFLLLGGSSLLAASSIHAADGTWNGISGNWSDITDPGGVWSGGAPADLLDSTAFFTGIDIAADQVITLDADRTIGNITFTDATTASNNLTISGGNILTLDRTTGAPVIDVTDTGRTLTISSQISGADGLQKNGTGTLRLSGANDYTGTTVLNGGILAISSNDALGATSGNTTIAATGSSTGPRLTLSGNITSAENISITGNTEQNQFNGVINNASGTNTLSGNITLANPAGNIRLASGGGELIFSGTVSQTTSVRALILQANTGAAITVNNAIANNNGNLIILGSSAGAASNGVTLKAASTAINDIVNVLENGLLKLGITNAIKTTSTLTLGAATNFAGNGGFDFGKFDLAGFNQTVSALNGTKNTGNTIGADSNRIVTNSAASGTSVLTVGNNNGTGTFNGVILDGPTAAVALTKIGTGTQTLVGNSNYSGVTTLTAGILTISNANALGSTAGNTTIAVTGSPTTGGQLSVGAGITSPENITLTGGGETGGQFNNAITGTGTLSGNITLSNMSSSVRIGGVTCSGTISRTGTARGLVFVGTTVNNAISNGGGGLLIYLSTTTLKGVSGTGIGSTIIDQTGTLKLGVTDALNTSADLTVGSSGTNQGTFDLVGFNQTIKGLISAGTGATRTVTNTAAGSTTSTLTVGNGGGNQTFSGTITGSATAKVALVKTGAGTQTLSGINTYFGATRIDAGSLALGVGGSINNSASVTIKPGATLNTSALASYTIPTGKPVNFSVDGTGSGSSGKISAAALNVSNATVTYDITGPLDDAAYVLAEYTGTLTGTFLSPPADPVGYTLKYNHEGNKIALVQTGGNLAPGISDIANLSVPSGGNTGALPFTVTDEDVNSVVHSGTSNNPTLVPNGNISFSGSGANRTVTVTPVSGQSGTATITVTLTDNGSLTAQDTFTLTVTDNYLSWATANGVTGGEGGDHDNDGLKNLIEYALIDGGERGVYNTNTNTITYTKRGGVYGSDLTYIIESSETLVGAWTDEVTHTPAQIGLSTISYTFTPSTPVRKFARLEVTSP